MVAEDTCFGFLGFQIDDGDELIVRGALLVTDQRGDPLELQVATPIKPNRVQQAIWADGLIRHVVSTLLAEPLIARLEATPLVVLTNRAEALEAKSNHLLAHVGPGFDPCDSDRLHQALEVDGATVCLSVEATAGSSRLAEAVDAASQMHELLNPMAVFDRIETAVTELAKVDERYA